MPIIIDPEFSVYNLVNRMTNNTHLKHRRTMSFISREIENAVILEKEQGRIFAGFQRMSRFIPQLERYTQLAQVAESVYVFGVKDVPLPTIENITYVYLQASDQLAKEWFLISHGQGYYSALATEELSQIDDPDEMRRFEGVWTFDLDMVKILEEWLTSAVDAEPLFPFEPKYQITRHLQIITRSLNRFSNYLSQLDSARIEKNELEKLAQNTLESKINELKQQG